jgi:hypothetical protein
MMHHDGRDYEVATSEAAAHYRPKFEGWIQGGKADARDFLQRLQDEYPVDAIVRTNDLRFDLNGRQYLVADQRSGREWRLHRNAVAQMVGRTGILTQRVADKMISAENDQDGTWGRELLLHNLRTIFKRTDRERVLVRAVPLADGTLEARGFLSDKYRRMSCGPIIQAFAETAMGDFGAVPLRVEERRKFNPSYYHDVRVGFSLALPYIFEPVNNEILILGLSIQNSDFGAGALTVRMFCLRIWCTNLMVTKDELRKVHLGSRLAEDIRFSQQTYDLDTQTMASTVRDIVRTLFASARVNGYMGAIRAANEDKVEPGKLFERLRKGGHILKDEAKEISALFLEPDVEMMPAGQTAWRAANAISLFANNLEDAGNAERAVEIRHTAGLVLDKYNAA